MTTLVQGGHNTNGSGSNSSLSVTLGANLTAGNAVEGMVQWGGAVGALSTVKIGTTSGVLKNVTNDATNGQSFALYYFINNPGGTTTVTANFTGPTSDILMFADEFNGTNLSTATFSGSSTRVQNAPGVGGTVNCTTGASFGSSGDLAYGCSMNDGAAAAEYTTGTGFTQATDDKDDAGFFGLSARSEFQDATGAVNPSFTVSTNNGCITGGITLTPGGGAATTLVRRTLTPTGSRTGSRQMAA